MATRFSGDIMHDLETPSPQNSQLRISSANANANARMYGTESICSITLAITIFIRPEQLQYPLPDTSLTVPPNTPTDTSEFDLGVIDLFPNPPMQHPVYKDAVNPQVTLLKAPQFLGNQNPSFTSIPYIPPRQAQDQYTIVSSPPQTIVDMAKQPQASKARQRFKKSAGPINRNYLISPNYEEHHRSRLAVDNKPTRPESGTIPIDQLPQFISKYREENCRK
ncbi:hypothetical protein TWF706_000743 [Orbilia oligospora]|nr:hypothetical protein TWF706_000743 [Orbilia oligospora]